ncbi:MAG: hypothetical protein AAF648_17135 [Pseudomonadota bacterium]
MTLIYLAIQLRQNTKASKVAAVQSAMESSAKFSELLATDEGLARTFFTGLSNPDELNATETRRFVSTFNVFVRREAVAHYLYQEGTMPKELWDARVRAFRGVLNQPGLSVYLETSAHSLPTDFRVFLEDIATQESTMAEGTMKLMTQREPLRGMTPSA